MSAIIGALRAELSASIAEFQSDLGKAADSVKGFAKDCKAVSDGLTSVGQKMSLAITAPLLLLGKASVEQAKELRQSMGQIEAALASTGGQSGKTAADLEKTADALENISTYDKSDILGGVSANLLRFGNISGDVFDRTQTAVVNLAARMGMDLSSAASVVGKALNQPLTGLTALRKLGVTFTEDQKKQILALLKAGEGYRAQGIILSELENKFDGAAMAARKAAPDAVLIQSWRNFQETLGQIIIPLLQPFVDKMSELVKQFQALNPELQKSIVQWAALAAIVGPALVVIGQVVGAIGALAKPVAYLGSLLAGVFGGGAMAGIVSAMAGLAGILAAVATAVAAVAAVVWPFRDIIVQAFVDIWEFGKKVLGDAFENLLASFGQAWSQLVEVIVGLWNGPLGTVLKVIGKTIASLAALFVYYVGGVIIGVITVLANVVAAAAVGLVGSLDAVVKFLKGDFVGAWKAAKKAVVDTANALVGKNAPKQATAAPLPKPPPDIETVNVQGRRAPAGQSFDLGAEGDKLKDKLDNLARAADKDTIAVRRFATGGLAPLAKALEQVDTQYESVRDSITGHIDELEKAGLGSKQAQETYRQLTTALADLERAHKTARDAAIAQYNAEKALADLKTRADVARTDAQIRDLQEASGRTESPISSHMAKLQRATGDLIAEQSDAAIKLKELENERAEAERTNDVDGMARLDMLIDAQRRYYDLVSNTTAEQLDAAESIADAWRNLTDNISTALSDLVMDFKFDFSTLRGILRQLIGDLLKPATNAAGDFIGAGIKSLFSGFFADGGYIPPGQWGIAGEEGMEPVFGGKRGATVFPATESSGGRGDIYIDARGADTAAVTRLARVVNDLQKREGGRVKSYNADQRKRTR